MAGEKFGEFYQITKLYSPNILQFNYYYQCFNIFAKLYFAKLIILHFRQTFLPPNFCPIRYKIPLKAPPEFIHVYENTAFIGVSQDKYSTQLCLIQYLSFDMPLMLYFLYTCSSALIEFSTPHLVKCCTFYEEIINEDQCAHYTPNVVADEHLAMACVMSIVLHSLVIHSQQYCEQLQIYMSNCISTHV